MAAGGEPREGPWAKAGVILGALALIGTYLGVAVAAHWPPFSNSSSSTSSSIVTSLPLRPVIPPTQPVGSVGATFEQVKPSPFNFNGVNVYAVKVRILGLQGGNCTIKWQTLNSLGQLAGTNGVQTTGTLTYNDDTWSGNIDVGVPSIAYQQGQWRTEFTIDAPNGVPMASVGS
jgi:hypothetical protein